MMNDTVTKTRIAVFVSGGGTNLQALIDAQTRGEIPDGEIVLVVASNPEAYALKRAENANIIGIAVSRKACASQEEFEEKICAHLDEHNVQLIVLTF